MNDRLLHPILLTALGTCFLGLVMNAPAYSNILTYDWSYSSNSDNGSGTLTVDSVTRVMQSFNGSWDGGVVRALEPAGTNNSGGGCGACTDTTDNIINTVSPFLTSGGFNFDTSQNLVALLPLIRILCSTTELITP
jgi:hypothetical protein